VKSSPSKSLPTRRSSSRNPLRSDAVILDQVHSSKSQIEAKFQNSLGYFLSTYLKEEKEFKIENTDSNDAQSLQFILKNRK
jgi:hypothetical protein